MDYFFLTVITWFIGQFLKFFFRYFSKTKDSKNLFWVFLWSTGAPSSHSAVLVSSLVLLQRDVGYTPLFMFACIVSLFFIYNLVADRKREIIRGSNQKVLDISGHTLFDIITGILLGLILGLIYVN